MSLGPIEYGDGGFVTSVDSKSLRSYKAPSRATAFRYEPKIVEGFACLYLKPHMYKSRIEVHERGCFNETLSRKDRVDLCIDHDESHSLGNTDDGTLELIDTSKGLAFRLHVKSQDDLDRLQGRTSMSVKYGETEFDVREVNGENVRFIKRATLVECSAVFQGAVPNTHLLISDAKSVGNFCDESQWKFACDGAFVELKRKLQKLDALA